MKCCSHVDFQAEWQSGILDFLNVIELTSKRPLHARPMAWLFCSAFTPVIPIHTIMV